LILKSPQERDSFRNEVATKVPEMMRDLYILPFKSQEISKSKVKTLCQRAPRLPASPSQLFNFTHLWFNIRSVQERVFMLSILRTRHLKG